MKKLILTVALFASTFTSFNSNAQAVEEGKILIDTYYGFPNLYATIFKAAYTNYTDVSVTGLGPLGIRGEYLVTDKIGLGLDLCYSSMTLSYNDITVTPSALYTAGTSKIGGMITFNYHFADHDNFDAYFITGVGANNRTFTYSDPTMGKVSSSGVNAIPVAARIGVGTRYFFTPNFGINLGLGLGQGSLINGGLSFKL